jgi:EAL domain-containing protein (putative c-di-GMP-specific phosphodiesterase class I)
VRSGIAERDEGGQASTMIQNAEAALHHARVSAQRLTQYSRDSHTQVVARLALEHKLRRALELNQFELYYQPKMGLKTRCIEGAEALIRWHDPDTGIVSPADFLPLLESTGLIVDVGDWVLRQAAADSRHWQEAGLATVRVAVNISPQQLAGRDFAYRFEKLIEGWVSGRCGLDIEITEGTLLEGAEAEVEMLERLRTAGVRIAIDDFGTGYSSLARLSTLPVDTLKIDRSFVSGLPNDRSARTLVETILTMARAFNMDVVAEGVETEQQLDMLATLGCDQAQGHLMSRPVPRDAFTTLLQRGNAPVLMPPDWKTPG